MKKALLIIIPLAILAFILAYWDNVKAATKRVKGRGNDTSFDLNTGGIISDGLNRNKLLKRGVNGAEVRELQTLINRHAPCPPIAIDGVFGGQTEDALLCWLGVTEITLNQAQAELE